MNIADRLTYLTQEDLVGLSKQELFDMMPVLHFEGQYFYSDGSYRYIDKDSARRKNEIRKLLAQEYG